jgi:acetyl esterase/lipase
MSHKGLRIATDQADGHARTGLEARRTSLESHFDQRGGASLTDLLDAELRDAYRAFVPPDYADLATARATSRSRALSNTPARHGLHVFEESYPTTNGDSVEVRIYHPGVVGVEPPLLMWIHGGGFVMGGIEESELRCQQFSLLLPAVVASVNYRLAPEHVFPAALDDCWAAWTGLVHNSSRLGFDPTRAAVAGSSAGACLAAALCQLVRDRTGPPVCFQALFHPLLDDRIDEVCADSDIFTRDRARSSWKNYLGPAASEVVPMYAAPARATTLEGLPPAYLLAAEFDVVRDQAISYASKLLEAGVGTELHVVPGTFHSFESIARYAEVSQRISVEILAALTAALNPHHSR